MKKGKLDRDRVKGQKSEMDKVREGQRERRTE